MQKSLVNEFFATPVKPQWKQSEFKPVNAPNFQFMTNVNYGAPVFQPSGYVFKPTQMTRQNQPAMHQQMMNATPFAVSDYQSTLASSSQCRSDSSNDQYLPYGKSTVG